MIIHQAELTSFSPNTFGRCVSINGLEVVLLLCLGELAHVSMKKSASHPHLLVTVRPGVLQVSGLFDFWMIKVNADLLILKLCEKYDL